MAGTAYQGTQLYAQIQGEDDALNVDMDATSNKMFVQWSWLQFPVCLEPELFPRYMSKAFSCTFSEVKTETNAEDFFAHLLYKITK